MKNYITCILILFILLPASAQEDNGEFRTLFGDRQISHGGYGAVTISYAQIDGRDAIQIGGRGCWILDHGFALGFAGTGFFNDYHYNNILNSNVNLAGGYGGLLLEPILFPRFPVHISIPLLAGVGGVAYTSSSNPYDWQDAHYFVEESTSFLIMEPGVELEFNIVRFFRLSIGGYYRITTDIRLNDDTPENALNGFSGGVTLKFGKF